MMSPRVAPRKSSLRQPLFAALRGALAYALLPNGHFPTNTCGARQRESEWDGCHFLFGTHGTWERVAFAALGL